VTVVDEQGTQNKP